VAAPLRLLLRSINAVELRLAKNHGKAGLLLKFLAGNRALELLPGLYLQLPV
jgi:hypothetical protein